jgi:hypothetical protein
MAGRAADLQLAPSTHMKLTMNKVVGATVVALVLAAPGCAHLRPWSVRPAQILGAFDAARQKIEQVKGPIEAIWMSSNVDSLVQSVLVRERAAVSGKQSGGEVVALPERYFIIDAFNLDSAHGTLSGVLGPRSSPVTMEACGTGFKLNLERREGTWNAQIVSGTVC